MLKNAYDISIIKNNLSNSICYDIGIVNNIWPGWFNIDNDTNLVNNISV